MRLDQGHDREILVTKKIPRPDQILVHDLVATPGDVPAGSSLATGPSPVRRRPTRRSSSARRVGADIATQLVAEIRRMGLPAVRASAPATPQINDIVIRAIFSRFTRAAPPSASRSGSERAPRR
jgi:hypothetical protein